MAATPHTIVIGGGLAGLAAQPAGIVQHAHTTALPGTTNPTQPGTVQ